MTRWIANLFIELWALFVDDFALAAGAAAWVLVIALAVGLDAPDGATGPLLFAGLASILSLSVWRGVHQKR